MRLRPVSPLRRAILAAATGVCLVVGVLAAVALTPTFSGAQAPGRDSALRGTPVAPESATASPRSAESVTTAADRCLTTQHRVILVDISEQRLWMCSWSATVSSVPVTTGSDKHPTPTGHWRVYEKETDRWLSGTGYSRLVDYWMPYAGEIGFHDSTWQKIPYGSDLVHTKGSHGCVHVPHRAMKRLYAWADAGTRVRVIS